MRDNNCVCDTTQHKLPMDLTHKLCKTDMINMNDIQLLDISARALLKVLLLIFGVMLSIRLFFTALAVEW